MPGLLPMRSPSSWPFTLALLLLGSVCCGCASVTPSFDPAVSNAFAHDEMRKMESASLELYYPAKDRELALRTMARLESCLQRLRALPVTQRERPKALVYITSAEFNNAYVYPQVLGTEQHMVLPHHLSLDLFNWFQLGLTDVGDVSCHEAVHYLQLQQTDGFWDAMNVFFGNLYPPNSGLETWFLEGLATYYEGRLGKSVGRSANPLWHGLFLSGVAARGGDLNPGDLSPLQREMLPVGGNYLTGMHFVEYLARKYGEDRLWQLIDLQGRSIFSPVLMSFRFDQIYGKHLGDLFEDFRASLDKEWRGRIRPATQRVLDPDLGYLARLAGSPSDGALASLSAGGDQGVTLKVREADGRVRFERAVTPLFFGRPYITVHPGQASGFSFSRDGAWLYVVTSDVADDSSETARLLRFDAHSGNFDRKWDLGAAMGGSINPDGRSYVFTELLGGTSRLSRLDLTTGQREAITEATPTTVTAAEYAPDGKRIAFVQRDNDHFNVWIREADGTQRALTQEADFNFFPHWLDDGHLVFLREVGGRWQIHGLDVATRTVTRLSDAPFVALDPVPLRGQVAFLNRDGWGWTLDAVALPPALSDAADPPKVAASSASPGDVVAAQKPVEAHDVSLPEGPTPLPAGVTDTAYSPIDHLFWPSLHAPWAFPNLTLLNNQDTVLSATVGVGIQGSDRLGLHSYALNVSYNTLDPSPSVSVGYGNYQLAPWFFRINASRTVAGPTLEELRGVMSFFRPFWTTPVGFGFEALQRMERLPGGGTSSRLVGPSVSASYFADDSTPYAGTRAGLALSGAATFYPRALGSTFDLADLGAQWEGFIPLPLLQRHTLRLEVRGRALLGAPDNLLQVGGVRGDFIGSTLPSSSGDATPNLGLPGGVSFVEPLRGYEDHALHATRAAIASVRYRYPFIIDRGTASLLYALPSLFVKQVDLEAFGASAYMDGQSPWHRTAGGAVLLHMRMGSSLPVTLFYQYAHRFDDGLSGLHYFGVSLE